MKTKSPSYDEITPIMSGDTTACIFPAFGTEYLGTERKIIHGLSYDLDLLFERGAAAAGLDRSLIDLYPDNARGAFAGAEEHRRRCRRLLAVRTPYCAPRRPRHTVQMARLDAVAEPPSAAGKVMREAMLLSRFGRGYRWRQGPHAGVGRQLRYRARTGALPAAPGAGTAGRRLVQHRDHA